MGRLMTAREQLIQAREQFLDAERNVWSVRDKAEPGDRVAFPFTNNARRAASERWIEACERFRRER